MYSVLVSSLEEKCVQFKIQIYGVRYNVIPQHLEPTSDKLVSPK